MLINGYIFYIFCGLLSMHCALSLKVSISCNTGRRSQTTPTSVHRLTPGDIDAVGALGDSITAAFAWNGTSLANIFVEWRGKSFSIGGDDGLEKDIVTIPNILKKFNPRVAGFSTGTGLFGFPPAERNYNAAITGAVAEDAIHQARQLVSRMQSGMERDFNTRWKLVTFFLGENDLCEHCEKNETIESFVSKYKENVKEALDYLYDNLPRTLVNLVGLINPTALFLHPAVSSNKVCEAVHGFTCECVATASLRDRSNAVFRAMNEALQDLARSGIYDRKSDFTVVWQPTFTEADLPKKKGSDEYDLSYMAYDCFHPNHKLHPILATELWKTMLMPVTGKQLMYGSIIPQDFVRLACPSASSPYIQTNGNS